MGSATLANTAFKFAFLFLAVSGVVYSLRFLRKVLIGLVL